jgi:hypothetical protein
VGENMNCKNCGHNEIEHSDNKACMKKVETYDKNNKYKPVYVCSCKRFVPEPEKEIPLVAKAYVTVEGKLKDIIPFAKEATKPEKEAK